MRTSSFLLLLFLQASFLLPSCFASRSVYPQCPQDPMAEYFTPEKYHFRSDGTQDVTALLQGVIDSLKTAQNYGILFIPEGTYRLGSTLEVPSSIRLIGYGKNRPVFYLAPSTPGFQDLNFMVWFTGGPRQQGRPSQDAGAGTFYSALSNIDFKVDRGNPGAACIRAHFAQHGFISHSEMRIGDGLCGIWDAGNELEDLRFIGGTCGIISKRTSPGWPLMMTDTYFEGQRQAAVRTRELGMSAVGMHVRNTPCAVWMEDGVVDRLHVEEALWENLSGPAVRVSVVGTTFSQVNLEKVSCRRVPLLVDYAGQRPGVRPEGKAYRVDRFTFGMVHESLEDGGQVREILQVSPVSDLPSVLGHVIPALPESDEWVSAKAFGAVGDGVTDDTRALMAAIESGRPVYLPQGTYRVTSTLRLLPSTRLVGLHPFATQIVLGESEPAFSGFGAPVPVVESSRGGNAQLSGIGIFTGCYNSRAVGLKWMAGEDSYVNDVKFVGGHGTLRRPSVSSAQGYQRPRAASYSTPDVPVRETGKDTAWDRQYWSLWITDQGGGTFKDIWTASTYASSGLLVSHTATPSRVMAMSLEHHVRSECRLLGVSNWRFYCFQFEEESVEGPDDRMCLMSGCSDLTFVNVWMYRVIKVFMPKETGFSLYGCKDIRFLNMHNYTQILPVIEFPVYDVNRGQMARNWDFAYLAVLGTEKRARELPAEVMRPGLLATGFELASGAVADSRGNVYFSENRLKRIYKIDALSQEVTLLADFPWKPFSLAVDQQDRVIVACRYDPQPGYMVDGKQETAPKLPDDNPMYSSWGNGGWSTLMYSFEPDDPDGTMTILERVRTDSIRSTARRLIHPASRWRGDYEQVVEALSPTSFKALDGVTYIPETYDLGRNCALIAVEPGQRDAVTVTNENDKTTHLYRVAEDGSLRHWRQVSPHGQYSSLIGRDGKIYIADGEVYVLDSEGRELGRISLPERPISMAFAGKDQERLIVTTSRSVYSVPLR